jgi:hypothetical protein
MIFKSNLLKAATEGVDSKGSPDSDLGSKVVYNQDGVICYKVSDYKALMELSSNTDWVTKQEKHAIRDLESGPNYVVFKEGSPYLKYNPDEETLGQVLDPKNQPLNHPLRPLKYRHVTKDPVLASLGQEIPAFKKFRFITDFSSFALDLQKGNPTDLLNISLLMGERWPEAEPILLKKGDPISLYIYARDVIKGHWPEAVSTFLSRAKKNLTPGLSMAIKLYKRDIQSF